MRLIFLKVKLAFNWFFAFKMCVTIQEVPTITSGHQKKKLMVLTNSNKIIVSQNNSENSKMQDIDNSPNHLWRITDTEGKILGLEKIVKFVLRGKERTSSWSTQQNKNTWAQQSADKKKKWKELFKTKINTNSEDLSKSMHSKMKNSFYYPNFQCSKYCMFT